MSKVIKSEKLTDNLTLTECSDGYWLYDYTREMNLSMRAETEKDAFVEALEYYQERTAKVEKKLKKINKSVGDFINSVSEDEDDD